MQIPLIDFSQPFYLISALLLFLLCLYLSRNNKTNTVMCITLLCFVTLLVCHTIELLNVDISIVPTLATCILVDELFTLVSFLAFLWLDRIEIENKKKTKSSGKGKKKKEKEKVEDKVIEDGLDVLWKKV